MSRVCFEFRDFGSCKYGQNCRFGHGVGAVAPAPMYPNYGYQDNAMNFPPQQPMRPQQVRVCFDFRDKGNCRYGTNCRYSHDVNQGAGAGDEAYPSFQNNRYANRNSNDRWRRDEENYGQQHFGNNGYNNNMRPQGFQRVCFDFRDLGSCRYGPQCKFSHDPNASASADGFNRFNGESKFGFNKGPKRRQLCHQFRDTGNCDYGDRCKFSHDLEEARGTEDHQENFYQQADGADAQPAASNDDAADAAAAVPSSDSAPQHELQ